MATNYHNRQRGFTGPLLLGLGVVNLVVYFFVPPEAALVLAPVGILFVSLSACFWQLDTNVEDGLLRVRFGPLRLFRTSRDLAGAQARTDRSDWLDGWGIHYVPGRPQIWNLHGFDCVEITCANGKRLRVGTNDPQGLADAINSTANALKVALQTPQRRS